MMQNHWTAEEAQHNLAAKALTAAVKKCDKNGASAEVVKPPADKSKASFGMTVTLRRDDGREQSFRIVGEDEADPSRGTVSY
jgi:transcription elongation GreA/GreB family factor